MGGGEKWRLGLLSCHSAIQRCVLSADPAEWLTHLVVTNHYVKHPIILRAEVIKTCSKFYMYCPGSKLESPWSEAEGMHYWDKTINVHCVRITGAFGRRNYKWFNDALQHTTTRRRKHKYHFNSVKTKSRLLIFPLNCDFCWNNWRFCSRVDWQIMIVNNFDSKSNYISSMRTREWT